MFVSLLLNVYSQGFPEIFSKKQKYAEGIFLLEAFVPGDFFSMNHAIDVNEKKDAPAFLNDIY